MPSNVLIDLLSGKTPVAMYDALHAERLLSPAGLRSPAPVIKLIRATYRSTRKRTLERVVLALGEAGYLNEDGIGLCEEET